MADEIRITYELDKEVNKKLDEIHNIVSEMMKTKNSPIADIWVTSNQLRLDLGISPRTEQNWLKAGILKKFKVQGKLFYKAEDVNNAILNSAEN